MRYLVIGLFVIIGLPSPSAGQTAAARAFISFNGSMQISGNDFQDGAAFTEHAEEGRLRNDYSVPGGPSLDIAAGARVWKQLSLGIAVARFSRSTPVAVNASVPHPLFFDRHRTVTADVTGLSREELAVHLRAAGVLAPNTRVQVVLFGGPTFFQVSQGVVTDIVYTETYPFDTATFVRGVTSSRKTSTIGFNAGADVAYFFTPQLGVGAVFQFSRANVDVEAAAGATRRIAVGGVQTGGGLRVRF